MDNAVAIDKWYYIMDKGFYYYRLNNNSQLVVAMSKDEADIFSYEEARRRIGNGKKAQFYFMVPTEEEIRETPIVTENIKSELVVMEGTSYQQEHSSVKPINQNTYDLSELDWKEYLTQFSYIASSVKKYHDELTEQLSQVDQKICDLMHYVEMYELSDGESLHVVEQLKIYREQRREIKDKMLISDTFSRLVGTSTNIAKSKETIRAITGLEHRKYAPRQLTELFEGRTLEVPKKITQFPVCSQEDVRLEAKEEEQMEDTVMEYTWRETVFDGRQTDWKQYAKQQMEFFEQAKQYICNLQIELDEIDGRIQDILREVEDANYNAVQGYNVFKQLKELRNIRKEKMKNLECVETLTGCFNCESMYEAYGYSLGVIEEIVGEGKQS
ncbi:MAG: hypothetical protein IJZ23_04685 [Roseburia sp.]|nr:hypothetical protein [Roseburia sp.]